MSDTDRLDHILKNMDLSKKKKYRIKYEIMWALIIIALILLGAR